MTARLAWATAGLLLIATPVVAAQYVYPAHGQDRAKQAADESECSTWASQQTGVDPSRVTVPYATGAGVPAAAVAPSGGMDWQSTGASLAMGALGGGGGLGGLGGAAGLMGGGMGGAGLASGAVGLLSQGLAQQQQHQQQQQQQQQLQQQQLAQAQTHQLGEFERARAACLTGRGYSVQ